MSGALEQGVWGALLDNPILLIAITAVVIWVLWNESHG